MHGNFVAPDVCVCVCVCVCVVRVCLSASGGRVLTRRVSESERRYPVHTGDAPIKVQHSSGREIGVNIKYLDNPFGIKYKLNGFGAAQ